MFKTIVCWLTAGVLFTPVLLPVRVQAQSLGISGNLEFGVPASAINVNWENSENILSDTSIFVEDQEFAIAEFKNPEELSLEEWLDASRGTLFNQVSGVTELDKINALSFVHSEWGQQINRVIAQLPNHNIVSVSHVVSNSYEIKEEFIKLVTGLRAYGQSLVPESISYAEMFASNDDREVPATYEPQAQSQTNSNGSFMLPWKSGVDHTVTQGWGGATSHPCPGTGCYGYDFDLSEGEEVRASADGTVALAKTGSTSCGGMNQANNANYVVLNHSDGSSTLYLHLSSVDVSSGTVKKGQRIGTAGKTGWTFCGPHLHFQRQFSSPYSYFTQSQEIYFNEYPGKKLNEGSKYKSQNSGSTSSSGCGQDNVVVMNRTFTKTKYTCNAGSTLSFINSKVQNSAVFLNAGSRIVIQSGSRIYGLGSEGVFRARVD